MENGGTQKGLIRIRILNRFFTLLDSKSNSRLLSASNATECNRFGSHIATSQRTDRNIKPRY